MNTFADKINEFNKHLEFSGTLPNGISIMNPFKESESVMQLSSKFYKKYYSDNYSRYLILGINPGRFGAGVTGIPFTDPKRLIEKCNISFTGKRLTHEPSSVFVYEVIDGFGGLQDFYKHFYINSVCPLGFTALSKTGKEINHNYDTKELTMTMYNFIEENIQKQISFGIKTDAAFCFGTGENESFLRKLNEEKKFFKKIIALEHPRYIMQYKQKSKEFYINKYISAFKQVLQ